MLNKEFIQDIELKRIKTDGSVGPSVVVNGNDVPFFTFSILQEYQEKVKAIFTTRLGGVSSGDLSFLNLSFSRGDDPLNVVRNFELVADIMEIDKSQFVCSNQTHTTNIKVVTDEDKGKGVTKPLDYEDIDGLVTNVPGLCLSLFYADCVPVYFYDPKLSVIGLAHSGWKGTVHQISAKMLDCMHTTFGTKKEDVLVAIGPSICKDCYEVSEDVAMEFMKVYNMDSKKQPILTKGKTEDKYQLNLWQAIYETLVQNGVPESQIQMPDICTCCNPRILFSHRASGGKRGNLGAFFMLSGCN